MARPRDPKALRRTGKPLHVLLPLDEHEAAIEDAAARGLSLAGHVRALLKQWRREHPARR
jgi:hypothetical protein